MVDEILVVDDHPANLMAIEAALGPLAAGMVRVQSGLAALRVLLDHDFAVILLDVRMPGLDGIQTARLIRQRERSRHIPIIFVTGYDRDERQVQEGYALGAVDFLFKPIVAEVLQAKVKVFVELRRQAFELAAQKERLREMEHAQRLADAIAEADRHKEQFLAMLGHELRNPLVPVATGLELLRRKLPDGGGGDDVVGRTLQAMDRQVRHLVRLVDDLLDIARINSGKIELRRTSYELQEVLEQAMAICRPALESREQKLEVTLPTVALSGMGDAVRLTQVIANLLGNAIRYTDRGGGVRLGCASYGDEVEIRVSDTGQGIDPQILPRIFDMYVQERQGHGGLGLGLMLVRRLVELHGGTVSAASDGPGQGSVFTVRLPLESPTRASQLDLPVVGSRRIARIAATPRSLRLVLVEDNADIRETMSELLGTYGHQVALAEDGPAGVALIEQMQPDVALVDIGLPRLDGYQLIEQVRRSLGPGKVRMVAMTGFGQEADRRRALEAGFDAHLVKPAQLEDLLQAIGPGAQA